MKISRDELVAVGKLLSTPGTPKVDTVEVAGETVTAKEALDAFEEVRQEASAPPTTWYGKAARSVEDKLNTGAEHAEHAIMSNVVGRFFAERVKPVDPLVKHEPATLHYSDGSAKQVDLTVVDTGFNLKMHNIELGTGASALIPGLGMLSYAGAAIGTAIAARNAGKEGDADKAANLWQTTRTNLWRAAGTVIPFAGHVVNGYIMAQEVRARDSLLAAPSVAQMTAAPA